MFDYDIVHFSLTNYQLRHKENTMRLCMLRHSMLFAGKNIVNMDNPIYSTRGSAVIENPTTFLTF